MQSLKEKHLVIMNAIVGYGLWPEDCHFPFAADGSPSADPNGYRNFELLKREVNALDVEEDFGLEAARKLFLRLRDLGNNLKQTFIRKTAVVVQQIQQAAPPPVDPKTQIPHRDKFPKIDSIEKAIRYVKTAKIPFDQLAAINELLTYLQQHDIHDWDVVDVAATEIGELPEAKEILQARALVSNLKISDIGSSTSA